MRKINVMLLTNSLGIGCTEKSFQILAKYIDKRLFNISFCCLTEGGFREKKIRSLGFKVYILKQDLQRFKKILIENKIDILHTNAIYRQYLELARLFVPIIIETSVFGDSQNFAFEKKFIDHILFVSKMVTLRYRKQLNLTYDKINKKSKIIYNPIDFESIRTNFGTKISHLKKKLGINSNDFIMGKIGRKTSSKWSIFLIDMIDHLQKQYKNFKVILIGTPPDIMLEIKRKKLEDYFILIKQVSEENLELFYELIDCLIHSSKMGESFGCTLAEAMAHKKPVIVNTTPLVDNAQIEVVDNQKTGLVVSYPETGVQAIMSLISDIKIREKLGQNGFQKAFTQYNAKTIARYTEKIYLKNLYEKNLITKEMMQGYQDIHIKPDMNILNLFEIEYQLKLEDYYGALSKIQHLKYLQKVLSKFISHILKNILFSISLYLLYSILHVRDKGRNKIHHRNVIKSNIVRLNYFLSTILKRKYYEILFL